MTPLTCTMVPGGPEVGERVIDVGESAWAEEAAWGEAVAWGVLGALGVAGAGVGGRLAVALGVARLTVGAVAGGCSGNTNGADVVEVADTALAGSAPSGVRLAAPIIATTKNNPKTEPARFTNPSPA